MENDFDKLDSLFDELDALEKDTSECFDYYDKITAETERLHEIAENFKDYIEKIDDEFAKKTKLTKIDIAFLTLATGLQVLRQYALAPKERTNDKKAAKDSHNKNENANDKFFDGEDPTYSKKFYYASMGDILDVSRYVPYDITNGSKDFGLGGDGKGLGSDHRFKVPGHDPILGIIYGTANILTNTITTYTQQSCHVKKMVNSSGVEVPQIYAKASTTEVFSKVKERFDTDKPAVAAALIKQIYHIKSDELSKEGIPIPFISALSPELAKALADYGVDWANSKQVLKQATVAVLIDFIIAMLHRLLYDGNTDMDLKLYKIRTKKILDYSGVIASASNIIYVSISAAMGNETATDKLDIGGIAYTVWKLIKDKKYMADVKKEFLDKNLEELIEGDY